MRPLYTQGHEFFDVVRRLRAMPSDELRCMALYAANYWSEERFREGEQSGDLPGHDGALAAPLNS